MARITISREELYEQVWQTPMSRLAAKFGVSDVAMAKTCRRLGIPKPGRGYWARLAAGESIGRPPLPKAGPRQAAPIVFDYDENPSPPAPRVEPPRVSISADLADAEKAVRSLGRMLSHAEVDQHERLIVPGRSGAVFAVTVAAHRRALLLLDSLFKALVARGHAAVLRRDGGDEATRWALGVLVDDETIEVSIVERLDREDHVLTADEQRRAKEGYGYGVPKYDYHPEGRLQLSLHDASIMRSSWSDGDVQRLEQHLGRAVLAVEAAAQARKRGREEAAERQREAEQRRRDEEQEEVRRREGEVRTKYRELLAKDLSEMARDWAAAEEIRRFLEVVDRLTPPDTKGEGFAAWFRWASAHAAALDPLSQPDRIAKSLDPDPADLAAMMSQSR